MMNYEHLAKIEQGVEAWNQWRQENPGITPNFSEADLRETNLSRYSLYEANMKGANLCGANLYAANLHGANLHAANLSGSNLEEARLVGAYLRGTNLSGANMTNADLNGACFISAKLTECDFSGSILAFSTFVNTDLRGIKGIEKINHHGPSSIGIDTLYMSKGDIPELFLRGCGVPGKMIEYAHSLTATPIQYYSCFISYSSIDEEFAKRVHNDLQAAGVRCWFAPHDLPIGAKTRPSIDEAIRVHDKLLLILTEHSVQSNWVEHEAEHALDLEAERDKLVLFPVRLDDAAMESKAGWAANVKRQRNIGDFTKWKDHDAYKASFERLLRDLKAGK